MRYRTDQAAAILGIARTTVQLYIRKGLIKAERDGRDYFIDAAEVERYANERRARGNPKWKTRSDKGTKRKTE